MVSREECISQKSKSHITNLSRRNSLEFVLYFKEVSYHASIFRKSFGNELLRNQLTKLDLSYSQILRLNYRLTVLNLSSPFLTSAVEVSGNRLLRSKITALSKNGRYFASQILRTTAKFLRILFLLNTLKINLGIVNFFWRIRRKYAVICKIFRARIKRTFYFAVFFLCLATKGSIQKVGNRWATK